MTSCLASTKEPQAIFHDERVIFFTAGPYKTKTEHKKNPRRLFFLWEISTLFDHNYVHSKIILILKTKNKKNE